jgi:phosphoribosylaminoimidazole (AIR) synthetase
MVVIVPATRADAALALLTAQGERASLIGEVRVGAGDVLIQ